MSAFVTPSTTTIILAGGESFDSLAMITLLGVVVLLIQKELAGVAAGRIARRLALGLDIGLSPLGLTAAVTSFVQVLRILHP